MNFRLSWRMDVASFREFSKGGAGLDMMADRILPFFQPAVRDKLSASIEPVYKHHVSPGFDSLNEILADFQDLGDGYAPAYAYDLTVMRSFFDGWMRRNSGVMVLYSGLERQVLFRVNYILLESDSYCISAKKK